MAEVIKTPYLLLHYVVEKKLTAPRHSLMGFAQKY